MFKKGKKIYSIAKGKCPRCHEGNFFKHSFNINPLKFTEIQKNCSNCNLKFMLEPSFFYGSMYVSYGVGIAFAVAAFVISYLFLDSNLVTAFIAIIGTLVVFAPIIMLSLIHI